MKKMKKMYEAGMAALFALFAMPMMGFAAGTAFKDAVGKAGQLNSGTLKTDESGFLGFFGGFYTQIVTNFGWLVATGCIGWFLYAVILGTTEQRKKFYIPLVILAAFYGFGYLITTILGMVGR